MRRVGLFVAAAMACAPAALAQTTAAQRAEVVQALATALEQDYVFPAIGKKYAAALRANAASPAYAADDDFQFSQKVTSDLNAVNRDKHLRLMAPAPPQGAGGPRVVRGLAPGMKAIEATDRLTPDIAYIRFGLFPGDAETLADLETFLAANAGVKTLIVDARGHRGGGMDEMDAMFADLFDKPVDLVQMETTKSVLAARPDMLAEGPTFRAVPASDGMARLQHFVKPSTHPRLKDTKLYVLQSSFSGSAAEHFLLAVKLSGRGKLVGETSAGAGHFGFPVDLPNGFSTFIPAGRTFDPATGWDWEGKGVAPDVAVPSAEALVVALKAAGVTQAEAEALDAKVAFVMPQRAPGGGPMIVRVPAPG